MSDELIDDNNIGKFRSQAIRSNFIIEFFSQLKVMLKRNFILQLRYRNSTLAQTILAPLIFQLLLFVLQQADYERQRESNPHPTPYSLTGIPTCQGTSYQDNNCINIFYTPAEEPYTSFMKTFAELNSKRMNQPPFPIEDPIDDTNFTPTKNLGIVGVPNADFIYDYVFQNPNTTRWGITFNQTKNETGPTPNLNIQYQIWYNVSLTANSSDIFGNELLGFVRGLDEAIITNLNDPNAKVTADIDVSLKDWPIIPPSTVSDLVVQQLVINQIVSEKELKLRIALEMMGLKPSVFWLSNFISNSVLVLCNALVTVLLGIAFNFTAFKNTSFFVNLLLFFLFGEAMVCFAYFITCFVQKAKIGILIGIFMFIIGLLFESFVFSSPFVGYIWWDPKSVDPIAWKTLIFIPFFNFGKMFLDIGSFTSGYRDALSDTFIPGPGFSVETLYDTLPSNLLPNYGDNNQPQVPRPVDSIFYLLMNIAFYYTLTLYFDQIVPNEFGNYRNLLFFLTPSYWGFSNKKELKNVEWLKKVKANSGGIVLDNEEEDVVEERKVALSNEHWPAIKIVNLRKVFRKSRFYKSKIDKIAVKDSCLTFEEGKLLALLGQNGAGKSTTMNILSGLTPATKGDALIYGYSVRYQMSKINEIMGSCPQHDILFEDLTAKEHIELYAGLKGVPKKDWPMLIEDRLKCVRLWQVRNARAGTYSGGMKRRLSLVISTIGDPKVIFMDEPTTGMDPVNRRHVWSFIENFKEGRVIVLTTHSMEEADVLGDRIAIMAHGAIKALGNSINLKGKYGAGYRINLITEVKDSERVKGEVIKRVPGIIVEDESAGALIFQFPNESKSYIPEFVEWLEKDDISDDDTVPETGVKAWGISQTTLEEVFLRIIRAANPFGYSGYEGGDPKKENKKNI